ncbi:hypothetical protein Agub_g9589 [Astrephomene gubernaculifera]|uniref:Uncharacterized protein n=1 Tax=Astrephomene gubernaculifera TaxID=47775 RepID=A0AAD3HP20_9CHLO|nr:hypothetical protein Agub_g9589 [Astrephomene gubernaculifera]
MKGSNSGLSPSDSLPVRPSAVPIYIWDDASFSSTAEVRVSLTCEKKGDEKSNLQETDANPRCRLLGVIAAVLTCAVIAAAVATPLCLLTRGKASPVIQVQEAGNITHAGTGILNLTATITASSNQTLQTAATELAWACVGPGSPILRVAVQNALQSALRSLGASEAVVEVEAPICNSTLPATAVVPLTVTAANNDLAVAISAALTTTDVGQLLAAVLASKVGMATTDVQLSIRDEALASGEETDATSGSAEATSLGISAQATST